MFLYEWMFSKRPLFRGRRFFECFCCSWMLWRNVEKWRRMEGGLSKIPPECLWVWTSIFLTLLQIVIKKCLQWWGNSDNVLEEWKHMTWIKGAKDHGKSYPTFKSQPLHWLSGPKEPEIFRLNKLSGRSGAVLFGSTSKLCFFHTGFS